MKSICLYLLFALPPFVIGLLIGAIYQAWSILFILWVFGVFS